MINDTRIIMTDRDFSRLQETVKQMQLVIQTQNDQIARLTQIVHEMYSEQCRSCKKLIPKTEIHICNICDTLLCSDCSHCDIESTLYTCHSHY